MLKFCRISSYCASIIEDYTGAGDFVGTVQLNKLPSREQTDHCYRNSFLYLYIFKYLGWSSLLIDFSKLLKMSIDRVNRVNTALGHINFANNILSEEISDFLQTKKSSFLSEIHKILYRSSCWNKQG